MTTTFAIPKIETERLIMRAPRSSDLPPMIAFWASDRSVHMGGPREEMDAWRTEAGLTACWITHGYGFWSLEDKAGGNFLGRVGLWFPTLWSEPELGWCLLPVAEGCGFAHEAAKAARSWAFETLGWASTVSLIAVANDRSIALAERLGAVREKTITRKAQPSYHVYRHTDHSDQKRGAA